jgi:hypothetical protein
MLYNWVKIMHCNCFDYLIRHNYSALPIISLYISYKTPFFFIYIPRGHFLRLRLSLRYAYYVFLLHNLELIFRFKKNDELSINLDFKMTNYDIFIVLSFNLNTSRLYLNRSKLRTMNQNSMWGGRGSVWCLTPLSTISQLYRGG